MECTLVLMKVLDQVPWLVKKNLVGGKYDNPGNSSLIF